MRLHIVADAVNRLQIRMIGMNKIPDKGQDLKKGRT